MIRYHAVMIDETGCEFGADVRAATREDTKRREAEIYARVSAEYDGDYGYE